MENELKKIDREIQKHKWILSEKACRDVGLNEARFDWLINHFRDYVNGNPKIEQDKD